MSYTDAELENLKHDDADYEDDKGEDEGPDLPGTLVTASNMLKTNAVLLEFLSNRDLCKTISKRERTIMARQLERIYILAETIDVTLNELGDGDF